MSTWMCTSVRFFVSQCFLLAMRWLARNWWQFPFSIKKKNTNHLSSKNIFTINDWQKKKKKRKEKRIDVCTTDSSILTTQLCMTIITRNEFVQQTWRCHGKRRVPTDENLNLLAQINACAWTCGTLWLRMCSKEALPFYAYIDPDS